MAEAPDQESFSVLRKFLPFVSLAIVFAALYVGWIFYSRWSDARDAQQASARKEVDDARRTVSLLGGGKFKILNFYALPGVIRRGDHTTICYGVSEATSVRIEPAVESLKPAISHCLQVSPKKTTEYRLIAEDGHGHTATESFTVTVQ